MKYFWLPGVALLMLTSSLFAQTIIKGVVTDENNQTIPFAAVYLSKTTIGTMSGKDGSYSLTIPHSGEYELISSCIGYKTFSRTISAEDKPQTISIKLYENTILLGEITVKSKDKNRITDLTLFNKLFLGETINAASCKILNPEDLYLFQDPVTGLIKGHSLKSLRIENKALGYTIVYDLTDFQYDTKNSLLKFTGSNYFIPLTDQPKLVKKWARNRLAAYYGSRLHFLQTLFADSLPQHQFQIFRCYLDRSKQDTLKMVPITIDSLQVARNEHFMTIYSSKPICVNYLDTHEELYSGLFGFQRQRFKSSFELTRPLKVFANGYFPNPYDITWYGELARERIADMLPYDFMPHGEITKKLEPIAQTTSVESFLAIRQKNTCQDQLFVHLDRNVYLPGDTLYFQAYVRNRYTTLFNSESTSLYALLTNEQQAMVDSSRFRIDNSTASGWMVLPPAAVPGNYHFTAFTSGMQNNDPLEAFQLDLKVREPSTNQNRLSIVLAKERYAPGDTLEATIRITDPWGNPIRQQRYFSTLTGGNKLAKSKESETNNKGEALIKFVLPDSLTTAPELKIVCKQSGGTNGLVSNYSIPLLEQNIELRFLPEGGTFVEGVEQKIGFNATNAKGDPVRIEGLLKNSLGSVLDTIRSGEFGPGSFYCTGRSGLYVQLTKGGALQKSWPLPDPSITGISLAVIPADSKTIAVELQSNIYSGEQMTVTGTLNMVKFFSQEINLTQKQRLLVDTEKLPAGVATITLFDKEMKPVSERLVYLNSVKHLNFTVSPKEANTKAGAENEVTVAVTDGEGRASEGFFSIAITDSVRGIASDLFAPGIEYTYCYHPNFPGNLPASVLARGVEKLTDEERDLLLMVYGWTKINWDLKNVKSNGAGLLNYDLLKLKVLYAGKNHKADRSLNLVSLEGAFTHHLIANEEGEMVLPLDSLSPMTSSVIMMPDVKSKNKATGAMMSIPYNEQYFKSEKLLVRQPLLPAEKYRIATPDQPFAMEEHTIEIPEITVVGHQPEKIYKDEFEKLYQADHVKSLDYEPLWSSSNLETAIRKLAFPYKITTENIYLHATRTILKGPIPALIVLDGMPLYDQGWPRVNSLSPSEVTSLTILDSKNGFIRYGEMAQGGVIFINTRSSNPDLVKQRTRWNLQNKNDKMLIPISLYRPRVECYNPSRAAVDANPLLQRRATIFWQSECYFGGKEGVKFRIPNLNHAGPVVISVNGVSVDNLVGSGRGRFVVQ